MNFKLSTMKKYKGIIIATACIAALFSACKKYETFPVDQININSVFDPNDSLGTNAYRFLNTTYAFLRNGHNAISGDYLDAASDDAIPSGSSSSNIVTKLSNGGYNSGTFADAIAGSNDNVWANDYAGIRSATIFITNIGVVPVLDAKFPNGQINGNGISTRYIWQSEARFLRAWFYFDLLKRYGGVPLLGNKVYGINDNLALPRNSFEQCVNYIVSECDAIKDSLYTAPLNTTTLYGRVTKGAALALKARVLLYAASPLYNGSNVDPANPLTGYLGAADPNKWVLAANAAQDVRNLNAYSLDTTGGLAGGPGFRDIFLTQNNPEIIMIRQGNNNTNVETQNAPVGFPTAHATGNTSPTQDLVDAFPMQNGMSISTSGSGYDPQNPYKGRDPRLQNSIFYNGHVWLSTAVQTYEGGQSKPNNGQQETLTGYYMRKFMGNSEAQLVFANHPEDWVMFRYAEVLLNYDEAENEVAGPTQQIYLDLIALRQRAGIAAGNGTYGLPAPGTAGKDSMRTVIRNERRIEMAFEEQRYFDIRRWKIAGDGIAVMNKPRMGVIINQSFGLLNYNYGPVDPQLYPVNSFTTKRYFYPIPYDEVVKNPNMKQNPGW